MTKIDGLDCILLVDDDQICNLMHKQIIESAGLDVHVQVAPNGQSAIDYLQKIDEGNYIKPGIIFLDINMPGMNGWEFLEKYHELPDENKVKAVVVMLSTSEDLNDHERAEDNPEVHKFMNKTLTRDKLEDVISTYFS